MASSMSLSLLNSKAMFGDTVCNISCDKRFFASKGSSDSFRPTNIDCRLRNSSLLISFKRCDESFSKVNEGIGNSLEAPLPIGEYGSSFGRLAVRTALKQNITHVNNLVHLKQNNTMSLSTIFSSKRAIIKQLLTAPLANVVVLLPIVAFLSQ